MADTGVCTNRDPGTTKKRSTMPLVSYCKPSFPASIWIHTHTHTHRPHGGDEQDSRRRREAGGTESEGRRAGNVTTTIGRRLVKEKCNVQGLRSTHFLKEERPYIPCKDVCVCVLCRDLPRSLQYYEHYVY